MMKFVVIFGFLLFAVGINGQGTDSGGNSANEPSGPEAPSAPSEPVTLSPPSEPETPSEPSEPSDADSIDENDEITDEGPADLAGEKRAKSTMPPGGVKKCYTWQCEVNAVLLTYNLFNKNLEGRVERKVDTAFLVILNSNNTRITNIKYLLTNVLDPSERRSTIDDYKKLIKKTIEQVATGEIKISTPLYEGLQSRATGKELVKAIVDGACTEDYQYTITIDLFIEYLLKFTLEMRFDYESLIRELYLEKVEGRAISFLESSSDNSTTSQTTQTEESTTDQINTRHHHQHNRNGHEHLARRHGGHHRNDRQGHHGENKRIHHRHGKNHEARHRVGHHHGSESVRHHKTGQHHDDRHSRHEGSRHL